MNTTPQGNEQHASHIPALATLINLGWTFLPATECQTLRGSQRDVVMKPVLERVLRQRRFTFKGRSYPLSDQAIDQVIREIVTLTRHVLEWIYIGESWCNDSRGHLVLGLCGTGHDS